MQKRDLVLRSELSLDAKNTKGLPIETVQAFVLPGARARIRTGDLPLRRRFQVYFNTHHKHLFSLKIKNLKIHKAS